jgi:three-Cys-motif partner protein
MLEFGNVWTEAKLNAIEQYLGFYTTALKKSGFRLCYVDAFAGSGSIRIKGNVEIEGSATRALKYPFDKYYFLEKNKKIISTLKQKINQFSEEKDVEFLPTDCNDFLLNIDKVDWKRQNWRGIVFLDPYALDLDWKCLEKISSTEVFDVWYLFPFMAMNRNLYKSGKIPESNRLKLNTILGTDKWIQEIYSDSPQLSYLNERLYEKADVEEIKNYLISRLKQTFPTVSDEALLLKNERGSPQFLLCFAGSNPSEKARTLSLKAADYILSAMPL